MGPANVQVRSVWAINVDFEMRLIHSLLWHYPFVSMDTEFPGVVYVPRQHPSRLTVDERYALIKKNVDALQLIQVGITLSDADGRLPDLGTGGAMHYVWEFNLQGFDIRCQPHNPESVNLLVSQGINLGQLHYYGIHPRHFSLLLKASRLVCNNAIRWITFHSAYDFAYIIKCLIDGKLPDKSAEFIRMVFFFFGNRIYDVKNIIRHCDGIYGGLEQTARLLHVERIIGRSHQAGSDALLIGQVFRRLREVFFTRHRSLDKYAGVLYGVQVY